MPVFDEIGKKISSVGQNTVKAVNDFSQTTKLKDKIKAEQNAINNYYLEIGQAYFKQNADTVDGPYAEFINQVRSRLGRIAELEREISVIQNKKTCLNCGAGAEMDCLFCPYCGTAFPSSLNSRVEDSDFCTKCGARLVAGADFCTVCGSAVEKKSETNAPPTSVCNACGAPLSEGAVFCVECGMHVEREVEESSFIEVPDAIEEEYPLAQEEDLSVQTCNACGAELKEDALFCMECGMKVEDAKE